MEDIYINRLDMFKSSLATLQLDAHAPLWKDKPPIIFTAKVADVAIQVDTLEDAQQKQESHIGGAAEEKAREESELERAAYILGQALALYFGDHAEETLASEVDLTPTDWAKLRDQQLLAQSQIVIDRARALAGSAAAAEADKYGINATSAEALAKERQEFDEIVNAPAVAIAVRKALSIGFRPAFNLVEKKFKELDKLILQFGATAAGRAMIDSWHAAREIRGPGAGKPTPPATPAGTTTQEPA